MNNIITIIFLKLIAVNYWLLRSMEYKFSNKLGNEVIFSNLQFIKKNN